MENSTFNPIVVRDSRIQDILSKCDVVVNKEVLVAPIKNLMQILNQQAVSIFRFQCQANP